MARLELSLLGGFHASVDGSQATGFDTDKTRALLVYLSVEPRRVHTREALAGLLWPELPEDAARRNLRNSLFKLRQALHEEEDSPAFLNITPHTVQFDPKADYRVDSLAFETLITACRTHRHRKRSHCTTCHVRFQEATELYRGDFLAGFHLSGCQEFEEWRVVKSEALHREALDALVRLVSYHQARGEYEQALQCAYKELELEPWREEAHRTVMRLLAQTGRRSEALAQYVACRRLLAQELDAEPGEETTALYEQIKAAGLEPMVTEAARHNLPRQLSPFVGRKGELARVTEQLDSPDYGLVTIIGPGGVGKTRLALQVAAQQVGGFGDGVYWIPLASVASTEHVPLSIAHATGLHLQTDDDPKTLLLNFLRGKEMLLLLDNFEQLMGTGGAVDLVGSILKNAPRTSVLVTSRERLGLQGEFLLDLSGLPFPTANSALAEPIAFDALQLFVERARQSRADFALTESTTPDAIEICRLVDGLPLGIVLAAPWVRYFPLARIAASIRENLDFLRSSARGDGPQHSSLRAVFDHSWALLSEEEKRVFGRLSVFRGGWEEEAAERVAGASLEALLSLVDKSLLRQNAMRRFSMHEVLRQYASEKLDEVPQAREDMSRLHADYFLEMAEQAEAGLGGEDESRWLEQLEREHSNFQVALRWAEEGNHIDIGLQLAGALSRYWFIRGYFAEGRAALEAVLHKAGHGAGDPHSSQGTPHLTKALWEAGNLARAQGDYTSARSFCEQSLLISREQGEKKDIATSLMRLAITVWNQGDRKLASSLYEEALAEYKELGDHKAVAIALGNIGLIASEEGDYAAARSLLEEGISLNRKLGNKFNLAIQLSNLANVVLQQKDYAGARALHMEGLGFRRELGDKWGVAICLIGLGNVAVETGQPEKGTRLLGAAEALLEATGAFLEPDDRIPYEQGIASARAGLGEDGFRREWAVGKAMDLERAIGYALGG